jgi:hypothetical protein
MFADKMLSVNLPYSEYWLPLLIGAGVGILAIIVLRSLAPQKAYVPREEKKEAREYDPFIQGGRSDQRRSFRRGGSTIRVHYAFPDRKNHPEEAWVIDRSMGGLCLGVSNELPEGTILSLLPLNAPPMTPWVDVEVRSCRRVEDQVELGCQFVKVPPWSILLLFG